MTKRQREKLQIQDQQVLNLKAGLRFLSFPSDFDLPPSALRLRIFIKAVK